MILTQHKDTKTQRHKASPYGTRLIAILCSINKYKNSEFLIARGDKSKLLILSSSLA